MTSDINSGKRSAAIDRSLPVLPEDQLTVDDEAPRLSVREWTRTVAAELRRRDPDVRVHQWPGTESRLLDQCASELFVLTHPATSARVRVDFAIPSPTVMFADYADVTVSVVGSHDHPVGQPDRQGWALTALTATRVSRVLAQHLHEAKLRHPSRAREVDARSVTAASFPTPPSAGHLGSVTPAPAAVHGHRHQSRSHHSGHEL